MIAAIGTIVGVLVIGWYIRHEGKKLSTPVWDHRARGTDTFTQNGRRRG